MYQNSKHNIHFAIPFSKKQGATNKGKTSFLRKLTKIVHTWPNYTIIDLLSCVFEFLSLKLKEKDDV